MIARLDGARVFRSKYVHVVNDACARDTHDNDGKKRSWKGIKGRKGKERRRTVGKKSRDEVDDHCQTGLHTLNSPASHKPDTNDQVP